MGPSDRVAAASAASKYSGPAVGSPWMPRSVARVPKIRSGAVNGSTSSPTTAPLRLSPTVNAAPIASSTDNVGVASSSAAASVGSASKGSRKGSADSGTSTASGSTETSQCALIFASTVTPNGTPESKSCSTLPSSASLRKSPSSASSADNSADTQTTPAPMLGSSSALGDSASGNSDTTTAKKISGLATSLQRRNATFRSRATMRRYACTGRPYSSITSVPGAANASG